MAKIGRTTGVTLASRFGYFGDCVGVCGVEVWLPYSDASVAPSTKDSTATVEDTHIAA
jgi:hypothetical protein